MSPRNLMLSLLARLTVLLGVGNVQAAQDFAAPLFAQRWQRDESIAPNVWGPLATATDGLAEPYDGERGCPKEVPSCAINDQGPGQRLVQYFERGAWTRTSRTSNRHHDTEGDAMRTRFADRASRFIRWDSPVGWAAAALAALGAGLFPRAATWCWVAFFLIAATLCGSSYRERCGRVHCRVTSPLFLLCAVYLSLVQLDLVLFIGNGRFVAVVLGAIGLSFLVEVIVGMYVQAS